MGLPISLIIAGFVPEAIVVVVAGMTDTSPTWDRHRLFVRLREEFVHKTDIVEGYESGFFVNESSVEECDKALPIEQDRQCKGAGWRGVVISYILNVGEKRNGAVEERRTKQGGRLFF